MNNDMNKDSLLVVVDDDKFAVKIITTQLKSLGFSNVKSFTLPVQALEYMQLNGSEVAAILCDLQMPVLDGIEFVRQLGQCQYHGHVVLVSGEDPRILRSAQLLAEALKLSVIGVVNKPAQLDHLRKVFEKHLSTAQIPVNRLSVEYSLEQIKTAFELAQFENYYQPKICASTGQVLGFESLIRWRHPTDGIIAPAGFLPQVEANGLCNQLIDSVLSGPSSVIHMLPKWRAAGNEFGVALNLSAMNMTDPHLPQRLYEQVLGAGLLPRDFVLEISENRLVAQRDTMLLTLSRLSLKGFQLSIDDFGTGQTTMSDLRDLPLGEMKFDQSFVYGAHRDNSKKMALKSCIRMAHELGMKTVAEGIEDADDWACLRTLGCDHLQGYFIARPMSADQVLPWLARWQERLRQEGLKHWEPLGVDL